MPYSNLPRRPVRIPQAGVKQLRPTVRCAHTDVVDGDTHAEALQRRRDELVMVKGPDILGVVYFTCLPRHPTIITMPSENTSVEAFYGLRDALN